MVSLIACVFALCGGLVVASLSAHGIDAEGEVRLLVAAARARWEQHDFHREGAREPGIAGNAFDAYGEAVALAAALPRDLLERAEQVANDRALWRAEDEARLAAFDPVIARLRQGAQRQDARPPLDWSRGVGQRWLDAIVCVQLLRVALLRLDHTPAPGDATALTLDLATFCGDLLGSPSLVEQMIGSCGLEGVIAHWTDERLGAAGPGDRAALAKTLRRLDARTSPVPPWLGFEAALAAGEDLVAVLPISGWQACLAAWRTGFSSRRMMFGAVAETMTSLADVAVEPDDAWPARTARLSAIDRRLQGSENLATRTMAVGVQDIEFERRKTLCRLRLLRLALAWHEGATLSPLPDPFERAPLRVVASGATAEFTSALADRDLCRTSTRR